MCCPWPCSGLHWKSAHRNDGDSFRSQPDAGERALASESKLGLEIILGKVSGPQFVNLPKREIRRTATADSYCVHQDLSCVETLPDLPRALRAMRVRDADTGNAHPGWEMATALARERSGREAGKEGARGSLSPENPSALFVFFMAQITAGSHCTDLLTWCWLFLPSERSSLALAPSSQSPRVTLGTG